MFQAIYGFLPAEILMSKAVSKIFSERPLTDLYYSEDGNNRTDNRCTGVLEIFGQNHPLKLSETFQHHCDTIKFELFIVEEDYDVRTFSALYWPNLSKTTVSLFSEKQLRQSFPK